MGIGMKIFIVLSLLFILLIIIGLVGNIVTLTKRIDTIGYILGEMHRSMEHEKDRRGKANYPYQLNKYIEIVRNETNQGITIKDDESRY